MHLCRSSVWPADVASLRSIWLRIGRGDVSTCDDLRCSCVRGCCRRIVRSIVFLRVVAPRSDHWK